MEQMRKIRPISEKLFEGHGWPKGEGTGWGGAAQRKKELLAPGGAAGDKKALLVLALALALGGPPPLVQVPRTRLEVR